MEISAIADITNKPPICPALRQNHKLVEILASKQAQIERESGIRMRFNLFNMERMECLVNLEQTRKRMNTKYIIQISFISSSMLLISFMNPFSYPERSLQANLFVFFQLI